MNMSKRAWFVGLSALAAFLVACQAHQVTSSPNPGPPINAAATAIVPAAPASSTNSPPSSAPMTPVEQAVAEHRTAILQQRGVVAVDVGFLPDGSAAMFVELCAEEAKKTLTLPELAVPVNVFVDHASTRASSKPCGCIFNGAYYEVGEERKPDSCNSCRCEPIGRFICTLVGCEIKILLRVHFDVNSAEPLPDANTNPAYAKIIAVLLENPDILLDVQGYADKGEKNPKWLSLRRAKVVYDRLIAAGAPRERLRGPTALGSTAPAANDKPELNRHVRFEVIMRP